MDWIEAYKKETGNDASHTETDEWNANRTHTFYYDEYIAWLEDKLDDATQQVSGVDRAICAACGGPLVMGVCEIGCGRIAE